MNEKILEKVNSVYYLQNTVPSNYLRKIFKSDKNSLLVFTPNSNYQNVLALYKSIQRLINKTYFGTSKKLRNPFVKCKTPFEIFNLHRRILIE